MIEYIDVIETLCIVVQQYNEIEQSDEIISELLNFLYRNRTHTEIEGDVDSWG